MKIPRFPLPFRTVLAGAALFLAGLTPRVLAQCAMCKVVANREKASGGSVADGISASVMFLIALPLVISAGFSFALWRSYRHPETEDPRED
ncbi:MAG: hypothetical protein ACE5H3_04085 [Planctomycetota bacterium]